MFKKIAVTITIKVSYLSLIKLFYLKNFGLTRSVKIHEYPNAKIK
jgi:hypothetical protein